MKRFATSSPLLFLTMLLALTGAAMLGSCSSRQGDKILNAIPADAVSVSVVDLDRLADLGETPSRLMLTRHLIPVTTGVAANAVMPDGTTIGVAPATAPDSLSAAGFKAAEAEGDLTPWTDADGLTVVVDSRKGIAYTTAMSGPRALQLATEIGEAAAKLPLSSLKGIADRFDVDANSGAPLYGAVSRTLFAPSSASSSDPQAAQWLAYAISEEGEYASVDVMLMEGSGKPVEIKGLQTVAPDFLRYVPADMNVVVAAGLTPEIDWDAAGALVAMVADKELYTYIAAAEPYLKSIDGTVAIAFGVDKDAPGTPSGFFAMARMERSKIQDFVKQAGMLAAMAGADFQPLGDNMARLSLPAIAGVPSEMYMGEVDGCLVISTFLPDGKASNSFAPAMEGHDAAAVVRFAPGAFPATRSQVDFGVDLNVSLDGSQARARIAFPGSDRKPLAVLADIF